jgi:hypothetical protein
VAELATTEVARLTELEHVIERGLETFIEVGQALMEIRERKLYRETHRTFEEYVKARWSMSGRRARHLISAAKIGTVVPVANESQARAFPSDADRKAIESVWGLATKLAKEEDTEVTAALIKEARRIRQRELATQVEAARFRMKFSPRGSSCGPTKPLPPERIPAALTVHDRIQAESDAIRIAAGLEPLQESATVRAWREQVGRNGNGNQQRDPVEALITRIEYVACGYPPETHDAFDEAIDALLKVREALSRP